MRTQIFTELKALYSMSRYPLSEPPSCSVSCEQDSESFRNTLRENVWDLKLRQISALKFEKSNRSIVFDFSSTLTMIEFLNRTLLSTVISVGITVIISYVYAQAVKLTHLASAILVINFLSNVDMISSYFFDENDFDDIADFKGTYEAEYECKATVQSDTFRAKSNSVASESKLRPSYTYNLANVIYRLCGYQQASPVGSLSIFRQILRCIYCQRG
jgi:hypothetical protein